MAEVTHLWRVIQEWLDGQRFPPSQSRLGESVGVARSAVSDWKLGKARPTPDHLRRLADLMEPGLGPKTYDRLLRAMLADMGYELPPRDPTLLVERFHLTDKETGEVGVYGDPITDEDDVIFTPQQQPQPGDGPPN